MRHRTRSLSLVLAAGATLVLGVGGVASAHVTAHAPEAAPGSSDSEITFRVPTESDTASTVGLQLAMPKGVALASVSVEPVPGWTATTTTTHLTRPITTDDGSVSDVVSQISWTAAAGQGIAPGQYQDFAISVGPLPKSGTLAFPAIQDYSDGTQVSWIDPTVQGQPEPEHPAPTVTIGSGTTGKAAAASPAASSGSSGPSGLAVTGVVLGAAALVAALAALALALRGRRRGDRVDAAGPGSAERVPSGSAVR